MIEKYKNKNKVLLICMPQLVTMSENNLCSYSVTKLILIPHAARTKLKHDRTNKLETDLLMLCHAISYVCSFGNGEPVIKRFFEY